ncbi:MAG: carbohydrate porin, partial [Hyphomicrobium sp.]
YTGEYYNVASGGLSRGSTVNGLFDFYADVDLERVVGWKGGVLHANVYYIHGEGPTTKRIGNIFAVTNIEALETFRLDELWFEQALLDDKLKIKLGAIAADTEFFASDSAGGFLNGTFGWAGILASNMVHGGPAYPLTAIGARVQFAPTDDLTILAAVFNGSPANPLADDPQQDNKRGTDFRFGDGALAIIEGQFRYDVGLAGMVKLGGWRQFNSDVYADLLTGAPARGGSGLYAIVDQQIWKNGEDQGVSVFGRVSGSPDRQNPMDFYFDAGIVFAGLVPGRAKDSFGAAFGYGEISSRLIASEIAGGQAITSDYESVLEINYTANIMPGVTIIPDFQYIWNPGGRVENPDTPGKAVEDATVFGVRAKVSY